MLFQGGSRSARSDRGRAASTWLTALGVGVAIGLLVAGGFAASSARQDAWRLAEQQASNLRLALARDIDRNITLLDLSLQGAIEALAQPGIDKTTSGIRYQALFDRAAGAEDLGSIIVLGPEGKIIESSSSLPPGLNLAGRSEFAAQRSRPDVGLFVSRASKGWFGDDRPSISISRRLPLQDGHFAGVVTGSIRLSYFQRLFAQIDVGPNGSITLLRTDGHIVWRYPTADGDMDRDIGGSGGFRDMMAVPDGEYVGPSVVDGVTRLYAFGRVGALPLILSVNLAEEDIYARWKQKAMIIGPVLAAMCASVLVLSLLFRREMMRRSAAEQALAVIASTDALTGLANRRTFEEEAQRELRRASSERNGLSLMMIDVDHFKSFNDRYGHPAGDRTLKLIAGAITANLLRPADLAARYGGEEFVVLLPACDLQGAREYAERLRAAVEMLGISHAGSMAGRVTISVGVATVPPGSDEPAFDLLKAADDELYAAKSNGRNRVSALEAGAASHGVDRPRLIA